MNQIDAEAVARAVLPTLTAAIINPQQDGPDALRHHGSDRCSRLHRRGAVVVTHASAMERGYRPCESYSRFAGGDVACWREVGYVVRPAKSV